MDETIIKHNFELFDWAKKNANGDDIFVGFDSGSASLTVDPTQVPTVPTIDEDQARFLLSSYYDDEIGCMRPTWTTEYDPFNLNTFQAVLYYGEIYKVGVWVPLTEDDRKDHEYFLRYDAETFNFDDPNEHARWERFYAEVNWDRYDRGQHIHNRLNDSGDKYLLEKE